VFAEDGSPPITLAEPSMITRSAAFIAILIVFAFLGWFAYSIASIPLTIVIAIGIALILADFYPLLRRLEER
jgi:hypothetical protein